MFYLNGTRFDKAPEYCLECKLFLDWGQGYGKGACTLFNITKNKYADLSKRCKNLFDKASSYPDGTELVIVAK